MWRPSLRHSVVEEIAIRGELMKKGMGWLYRPWVNRHFVYYEQTKTLNYYTRDGVFKGSVQVEGVRAINPNEADGKDFAFEVICRKKSRRLVDKWKRRY